jgi:DNA-binding cell septation regulator SpoVG
MGESHEMPGLEPRVKVCRQPLAYGSAQLLGFAELVIGGSFVIRDIRILKVAKEGTESVFVAFPSRRWNGSGDGEERKYYDVAFPITSQSYREATGAILKAFEEAAAKA